MTTLTQAMATTFRVATQSGDVIDVAGRNMGDKMLEKYAASSNKDAAVVARFLLSESYVTYEVVDGAKRVVRVPHPTPTDVPDDDGFGPLGATVPAQAAMPRVMPQALVPQPQQKPAPAPWDAETPEWAKALQRSMDKLIHDFSRFEILFDVAERMAKAPAQTTAPGVGQGAANGGGQFVTEKIEALKNKGKLSFKVKGGRYQKFGVTVWPEVMEEHGFKLSDFPVGEEVPFPGHTAIFIFGEPKEDGGPANPDKIIRFIRCDK